MTNYVTQSIHFFVSVKGINCFEDLNKNDQYNLVCSALAENFSDISKIEKSYSKEDFINFKKDCINDEDLKEDLLFDLTYCYEYKFDHIFEEFSVNECADNIHDAAWHAADPVALDRQALSRQYNYQNSVMDSIFKL